jgi:hypothetical protein
VGLNIYAIFLEFLITRALKLKAILPQTLEICHSKKRHFLLNFPFFNFRFVDKRDNKVNKRIFAQIEILSVVFLAKLIIHFQNLSKKIRKQGNTQILFHFYRCMHMLAEPKVSSKRKLFTCAPPVLVSLHVLSGVISAVVGKVEIST